MVCRPVLGFAEGAPTSTCDDMKPEHKGVKAQTSAAPFTIFTSNSTFQTGQPVMVFIRGAEYEGFLLQARSGSNTAALGSWETPPANTKHLKCSENSKGAVTHANINKKNNQTEYTWMPPATSNSIYFIATIAEEREMYWLQVKSATLTRVGTNSAPDPKVTTRVVLLCIASLVSTVFLS